MHISLRIRNAFLSSCFTNGPINKCKTNVSSREWCIKATIRTQSNISHNQFSKYAVKNGSNVISVMESPLCFSRTTFHLYGCHGDWPYDSAPVEQTSRSNSDLPSFFHLLFDCLGNILTTDLSANSQADVHWKIKCKHRSYHLSWLYVQFNNFKWNLDLVFKVIVHPKWKLWLLFPFPHIVSFFRGTQRGIFEVCPGHAFQYNEREWGMGLSSS